MKKNYTVILIDAQKAFHKIQNFFMMKTLSKVETEENLLNITEAIYEKPTADIILNA